MMKQLTQIVPPTLWGGGQIEVVNNGLRTKFSTEKEAVLSTRYSDIMIVRKELENVLVCRHFHSLDIVKANQGTILDGIAMMRLYGKDQDMPKIVEYVHAYISPALDTLQKISCFKREYIDAAKAIVAMFLLKYRS